MAINRNGAATKYSFLHNGKKLKKGYHNGTTVIWTAGDVVTYHVDTGVSYTEEVDDGATCLAPTTFTPTKDGWTFLGWKEDSGCNDDILHDKVMNGEPVDLYAVFSQPITVTYYNNKTTPEKAYGNRYYNNGNIVNPKCSLTQDAKDGWTARGWATGTAADAAVAYRNFLNAEVSSDVTIYGLYEKDITLITIVNRASTPYTETAYYNSAGNSKYPTFTVANPSVSGYTFMGWSTSESSIEIAYDSISGLSLTENLTVYAVSKVYIISDSVLNTSMASASSCEAYDEDAPLSGPLYTPTYYGILERYNGHTAGGTFTGSITLLDKFVGKKLYWDALYWIHNSIFSGNNSWYGKITNGGDEVFSKYSPSYTKSPPDVWTESGNGILDSAVFELSVSLSRGANPDQNTQVFISGVGFTNLYAIGVF